MIEMLNCIIIGLFLLFLRQVFIVYKIYQSTNIFTLVFGLQVNNLKKKNIKIFLGFKKIYIIYIFNLLTYSIFTTLIQLINLLMEPLIIYLSSDFKKYICTTWFFNFFFPLQWRQKYRRGQRLLTNLLLSNAGHY